jgi:hypothetical protein
MQQSQCSKDPQEAGTFASKRRKKGHDGDDITGTD